MLPFGCPTVRPTSVCIARKRNLRCWFEGTTVETAARLCADRVRPRNSCCQDRAPSRCAYVWTATTAWARWNGKRAKVSRPTTTNQSHRRRAPVMMIRTTRKNPRTHMISPSSTVMINQRNSPYKVEAIILQQSQNCKSLTNNRARNRKFTWKTFQKGNICFENNASWRLSLFLSLIDYFIFYERSHLAKYKQMKTKNNHPFEVLFCDLF